MLETRSRDSEPDVVTENAAENRVEEAAETWEGYSPDLLCLLEE